MKILVGLSGGVDSAVAAYLLKEAGFDVTCCFMRNWDSALNNDTLGNDTLNNDICPQEEDYNDAKAVADKLGLKLLRSDYIEEYWDAMIEAAKIPFFIYNIPSTTGYNISMSLFEKMIGKPYVAGIKTTSPNSALISRMKRSGGEKTLIFNGEDAQLLAGLSMGATGGIGGTYGAMPELYVNIYRAFCEGDMEKALLWQNRADTALMHGRVSWSPGVASMKAILNARGMDCGGVRAPFKFVPADTPVIREAADMIESWLKEGY